MNEEPDREEESVEITVKARFTAGAPGKPPYSPRRGFRQRELFWGLTVGDFVVVVLLAVGMQFLEYHGALSQWEGRFLDRALQIVQSREGEHLIVAVEIDQEAYQSCFCGTSPLDPATVMKLVGSVAGFKPDPAAIGVDLETEDSKYAEVAKMPWFEKSIWAAQPILAQSPTEPGFFSWLAGQEAQWKFRQQVALGGIQHRNDRIGTAIYLQDRDFGVRKLTRRFHLEPESAPVAVWPTRVAETATGKTDHSGEHEVLVSYTGAAPLEFQVSDLFQCAAHSSGDGCKAGVGEPKPAMREILRERIERTGKTPIFLIGGTYKESRDSYPTPIGRQPGILVNAYAVRAELQGSFVREIAPGLRLILDILSGIAVVLIFHRLKRARHAVWATIGLAFLILAVNLMLVRGGYLWFSFAGVAFGTLVHQLVEFYTANPKLEHPA